MTKKYFKDLKDERNSKRNLKPSFSDELFASTDGTFWPDISDLPQGAEKKLSEKSLLIDSMTHYVNEQLEEQNEAILKVNGGSIAKKVPENKVFSEHKCQVLPIDQLKSLARTVLGEESSSYRYAENCQPNVDFLFVSDDFSPASGELKELPFLSSTINQYFKNEAQILFSNMSRALKREESKVAISSPYLNKETNPELENLFYTELCFYNPKIIISLGAKTTALLLKERRRIADVHGQVFNRDILFENENRTYPVMPLFHPAFLFANPNMKEAAWIDLQKAMSLISD